MVSNGRPRLRVSFALGSWQVVALAAALAEADASGGAAGEGDVADVLVLYETGPASAALVAAMRAVAAAVRPWRAVVEAFEPMASVSRDLSQAGFERLQARLRGIVGPAPVDELWLCRATRGAERLAMETWPSARVALYEDGVLSYLPQPPLLDDGAGIVARWRAARERARPVRRLLRAQGRLDPRHAARLDAAWMLLGDVFPPPPTFAGLPHLAWRTVAPARLRAAVDACAALPAVGSFVPPPRGDRPAVLVLGQALSRFHATTREAERHVYAAAIDAVVGRGYDVWWKEHPRAERPFFAELAASAPPGRLRELALPFALPVELVAGRLGLAACVGGMTTALFYLPRLFGMPAFSVAAAFVPLLRGDWALQNRLFVDRVAPLPALPPARPSVPT